MSAAIDYLRDLGHAVVTRHERRMLDLLLTRLQAMEGARVLGSPSERVAVVSFVLDGIHPHDIGSLLAQENVAVRTGLHCAEPVIRRFGERATVRASVGLYTTASDIERLVLALARVQELLG
jgi:cysteine desulfurase/selenocysteine lyase